MKSLSYRIGYTTGRKWALQRDPKKRVRVLEGTVVSRSHMDNDMQAGWLDAVWDVEDLYRHDFEAYHSALRRQGATRR